VTAGNKNGVDLVSEANFAQFAIIVVVADVIALVYAVADID
jgi:hypothetical protein